MSPKRPSIPKTMLQAAPVFAALGDEIRLAMVARLSTNGPLSIARLTVDSGVTRQAVTKHLQVLSAAGIVRDYWVGRERVWELEKERLREAGASLERDLLARLTDRTPAQVHLVERAAARASPTSQRPR